MEAVSPLSSNKGGLPFLKLIAVKFIVLFRYRGICGEEKN